MMVSQAAEPGHRDLLGLLFPNPPRSCPRSRATKEARALDAKIELAIEVLGHSRSGRRSEAPLRTSPHGIGRLSKTSISTSSPSSSSCPSTYEVAVWCSAWPPNAGSVSSSWTTQSGRRTLPSVRTTRLPVWVGNHSRRRMLPPRIP